jgi:hypothetical protein
MKPKGDGEGELVHEMSLQTRRGSHLPQVVELVNETSLSD